MAHHNMNNPLFENWVLMEDNHLMVIDKPPGLLVQGDHTRDTTLLDMGKAYIGEKYHKPGAVFLGLVHRLDRPVSGAVVLARTSKALKRMNALFRQRQVQKIYWAITEKAPATAQGTLVHWLVKDPKTNKTTTYKREHSDGLKAELHYRTLHKRDGLYLLEVMPVTGRPHQIRAQLSAMGCPIVGDVKYGYPPPNTSGDIGLHARQIVFEHPVSHQNIDIIAPLPNTACWNAFRTLTFPT